VNSASGFKEITYQEGDFGTTAPLGRAQVYSNTGTCMTDDTNFPGACTKNYPYQATTAVLLLNTNCTTQSFIAARPIAARHELGHAFGLRHYSETGCEGILMDRGACSPHASSVTAHDAELVDLLY
jgi:hypothetical protein